MALEHAASCCGTQNNAKQISTCMVQGGYIHKVCSPLKVLTEQPMRPEQRRAAHAAPSPEFAPNSPSNSQAWITCHTNHFYPVGLVGLTGLAVCRVNLPVPAHQASIAETVVFHLLVLSKNTCHTSGVPKHKFQCRCSTEVVSCSFNTARLAT